MPLPGSYKRARAVVLAATLITTAGITIAAALGSSGSSLGGTPESAPRPSKNQGASAKAIDRRDYPRTLQFYGYGPVQELARYDMLVGYEWFDIRAIRTRNPGGIFLLQPAMEGSNGRDSVHVTAPGGAVGWKGARDSIRGGKPLGRIRAIDPYWDFLHNADGSVAAMGKVLGWNLAAPPAKGVAEQVAKIFAYAAKRGGLYRCTVRVGKAGRKKRVPCWNGIHSDNWIYSAIGANWLYGPNLDADRDKKVDDPRALRRNWSNGLTRSGMLLRSYLPGLVIGGNGSWYQPHLYAGSDPNGWLKASNYTLIEEMERIAFNSPEVFLATARRWLDFRDPYGQPRYMAVLHKATDINGNVIRWLDFNPNTAASMTRPDVLRSMRWGLTLSLMTGVYYELYGDFWGNSHETRWWFDEYDGGLDIRRRGYLGQPLGPGRKLAGAVYRRDFEHGIAINNSSSRPHTIALGGTFRKLKGTQNPALNDGSRVNSVTIPAKDGIIVLRIGRS
jgi:hypothetical protein